MTESTSTATPTTVAATKFDYLLNCGFENLKICHHPDVVVKQAYSYTSLKHSKEWNKANTMLPEAAMHYRWSLVRTMLINEGMTPMVRDWYALLPTEIQELPVSRYAYYFGDTLIDHFNMNFQFPTLEQHYRSVLENMKLEKSKVKTHTELCQELLSRGFRVNSIYGAVPTLTYDLYVAAVIEPLPKTELVINLVDSGVAPADRTWPVFYQYLRTKVTFRGLYRKHIPDQLPVVPTEESNKPAEKKLSWKDQPQEQHPRQEYNKNYLGKRRRFLGQHMNAVRSTEGDELEDETDEAPSRTQANDVHQSLFQSKMNALHIENQSLKNQITELNLARQQDSQQQATQIATQMANMRSQINSLMQQASSTSRQASTYTGGGGGYQANSRKRSKMNSNKPADRYQGGGSSGMNIYAGGGGQQAKQPSKKAEGQVDRHLHNPPGPEPWKRWLRVCNNCGRHGAHFGKRCKGQRRYNWTPSEDPRLVQPIEPYPANRQAALERCREEVRLYGATGVRWNCLPHEIPDASELA